MLELVTVLTLVVSAGAFLLLRLLGKLRSASHPAPSAGCCGCSPAACDSCPATAHRRLPIIALIVVLMSGVLMPGVAWAADTVETWDPGAADVDFYLGFDGVGAERSVYGDIMVGYGHVDIPQSGEGGR
jgi:hypothetical protein